MSFTLAGVLLRLRWSVPASVFPGGRRTQAVTLSTTVVGTGYTGSSLSDPGTQYLSRWNQLDFGLRRTFRFERGVTVQGQIDLFNALNSNTVLTEGTALSTTIAPFLSSDPSSGGTPTSILQPRIIRLAAQFRF